MSQLLRRGVVGVAAVVLAGLVGVALVEAGVAIGSAGHSGTMLDASSSTAAPATLAASADGVDLTADVDALLAADQTAVPAAASAAPARPSIVGVRRAAVLRRLVHGTVVVDLPRLGGLTTVQLDHGTIGSVSATSVTIRETGGTEVTVGLGDETRVRKHAARAGVGDLATGDEVFVMSRVETSGTVAYLVVVPVG